MHLRTFEIIKKLEEKIRTSYELPIFKGYKAINKSGVEKIIDELYSNLVDDVQIARNYLKNHNIDIDSEKNSNVYDSIKDFELKMDEGFPISEYVIVKVKELENVVNQIYKNLPKELLDAKNMDK